MMELALNEVKIQAKKLLKHVRNEAILPEHIHMSFKKNMSNSSDDVKLKHCLHVVSQHFGFTNWHHCQLVLSGNGDTTQLVNMGGLFYTDSCGVYINQWFASYNDAKQILTEHVNVHYLLPYKTQFVVVKKEYLTSLLIEEKSLHLFKDAKHDLYKSYNTLVWDKIAFQIIKKNAINP